MSALPPVALHDPRCGCADCRWARQKAEPTHRVVPGAPWGVTTACGVYTARETPSTACPRYADPAEAPTCPRCLEARP